jgi:subtilase family serine protease
MFNLSGTCGVPGVGCHAVGPYDFAEIYDVLPLWTATPHIDGTGQTIAIVADSNINVQDVRDFRNFFGLAAKDLVVIVDGPDPGLSTTGDETEADLDVEWAGAVAPNATIDLIVSETTESTDGVDLSSEYAVQNNVAPILNVSFGECEAALGTTGNQFFSQLWQQAAAQGITVLVASGDSGSAGCDNHNASPPSASQYGLQVSGFESTPYNVSVGGTDFNDLTNPSTYWNTTNSAPPGNPGALPTLSAKSYIPETTWNDSCTNTVFGTLLGFSANAETNCNNSELVDFVVTLGGSGGESSCTSGDGSDVTSCLGGYSKPSWQVGSGVPSDGKRDVPDVSLFASVSSPSGSFYIVCEADALFPGASSCDPASPTTNFLGIGGTSASSPSFAGIMALVNQETHSIQGNANYILYKLAAQQPSAFHDVPTGGTIAMPCATGSPNCVTSKSGDAFGVLSAYSTTSGYDLATGLGSVDANNFVTKWSTVTTALKTSSTTLTLNSGNPVNITHGQSVGVAIGVTGSPGTPTGNASLIANTGPNGTEGVQAFMLASGGSVSGATNALPGGTYTLVANYPGDGIFGASASSPPISVTVAPEASRTSIAYELFSPTTGLQTSANATTAVFGTPSVLRVNVTSQAGDACPNNASQDSACPTGNVVLMDNGNPLGGGTFALNAQGYTEDRSVDLTGGTHNLTATYSGDASFTAATPVAETVTITAAATTTSITAAPSSSTTGAIVSLTATITAQNIFSNFLPGGTVTFYSGSTPIATAGGGDQLQNPTTHQVTFITFTSTTTLPHGQNSITGHYSGDGNYAASISAPVIASSLYPTGTSVTSSSSSVQQGASATFTAQVNTSQSGGPAITGTVNFAVNGGSPAAVALSASGQAQFTTSFSGSGNYSVLATYSGDANYASSLGITNETVTPAFTMTANPMAVSISAPGQSGSTTLTFTSMNGFSGSGSLSAANCMGLPLKASCSFSPAMISLPANGTATTTLTIATSAAFLPIRETGPGQNPLSGWRVSIFEAFLAMLLGMVVLARSIRGPGRRWSAATGSLVLAIAIALVACGGGGSGSSGSGTGNGNGTGGGGGNTGTPPGQYVISVSATVNGAPQSLSGLSVNVQ